GKVSDAVEGDDLLGLEIADAKAWRIAFGLGRQRYERGRRPSPRADNLAQNASRLLREGDAEIIAAIFGRRDGRIVQRHANDDNIPGVGTPLRKPRDERAVAGT